MTKAEVVPALLKLAISQRGGRHLTNKWTNSSTSSGETCFEENADVKKNKEEFAQQTWGLSGDVIGKRRWCPWKRH